VSFPPCETTSSPLPKKNVLFSPQTHRGVPPLFLVEAAPSFFFSKVKVLFWEWIKNPVKVWHSFLPSPQEKTFLFPFLAPEGGMVSNDMVITFLSLPRVNEILDYDPPELPPG